MTISEDRALDIYKMSQEGCSIYLIASIKKIKPATVKSYKLIAQRAIEKREIINDLIKKLEKEGNKSFLEKLRDLI